ncbi:hypothetical protein [uncultured Algimonas sp.]|uniref:hypothetical protein n=1 Tax=uncultured Algimonas sp. TaxID=1547920 RepID=UPI0026276A2E|nr:hypothetical protein [uncultured Algimonas sp.]
MTSANQNTSGAAEPTPMMAQYLAIKDEAGADTLLLYRMGDFYEVFFRDAGRMAMALDIALTRRGKYRGQPIPMAGVPVHASETYIARLVKAGFRVAIAEQTEDPMDAKRRGPRAVVRREIIRIVTPSNTPEPVATPLQTETTEEGEQTLVHGVRPVTLGERLTARTRHPSRPRRNPAARQLPCDLGLFDEVGRAQTDLLDLIDQMETQP